MCLCMSVKSSTELMLYVVLTMPTLNKAYLLFIYGYFIGPGFKDISPLHSIMIMKSLWCLQFSSIGIDKGLNLPCFR